MMSVSIVGSKSANSSLVIAGFPMFDTITDGHNYSYADKHC
jgi:hypothetical protein